MPFWARLRRQARPREHAAAEWLAAGSPLPDEQERVDGLAFELGQVLWIQGRRGAKPWAERQELIERIVTSPRWREAGYQWTASGDEGCVTDAAGNVHLILIHEPDANGHTIERYADGRLVQRTRFDENGRVIK